MTAIRTSLATLLVVALAAGGAVAGGGDGTRTALVIDASLARDGRELVDPRLEETAAEVRLPRTPDEARTNVRYFAELGYQVVVAGPDARAAAKAAGGQVDFAGTLAASLTAAAR
jgi:hypothetical protein